jgi:ABC-type phosphate transport system substrate-binding protein
LIQPLVLALFFACDALAGVSVIVHPSQSIDELTRAQAVNVFLGKIKTLPSGTLIIPIDQERMSPERLEFYEKLANKNQNQLNAYWARQVFTGKGQPPSQLKNNREVKLLISNNPGMIGYIDSSVVDDTVKVILTIP